MSKAPAIKVQDKGKKPSPQYEKDRDAELIRGIFHYYEVPGGMMELVYRKHKGKVENYTLVDGEVCQIPVGLARHLNTNCWYPIYEHSTVDSSMQRGVIARSQGSPHKNTMMRIAKKIKRVGFQTLEFTEYENMDHRPTNIVGVETVNAAPMGEMM